MSSGFITEAEIEEQRRTRQQEWEKVRKPDQPIKAPEEEYDSRTLFERLEEQRKKKEFEYEETHKLKNMIKGLDDDEIEFLDMVDRTKMEQEKRLKNEEAKELQQYRNKVAALKEQSFAKKIEDEVTSVFSTTNETLSTGVITPRNKILAGIVKKRAASNKLPNPPVKKCANEISNSHNTETGRNDSKTSLKDNSEGESEVMRETMTYPSAMQCVGILPGIGTYISDDSSDSDNTSGSELEDNVFDLRGQKVQKNVKST